MKRREFITLIARGSMTPILPGAWRADPILHQISDLGVLALDGLVPPQNHDDEIADRDAGRAVFEQLGEQGCEDLLHRPLPPFMADTRWPNSRCPCTSMASPSMPLRISM
jgi:hypothetical protein